MLNAEQREAALHITGPMLVLAGAGSGKTKVIIQRICNLIEDVNVEPEKICAVTFTNKAAKEMRKRLKSDSTKPCIKTFIGTFHSLGLSILKEHANLAGLEKNFSILSVDDQLAVINDISAEFKLDPTEYPDKQLKSLISQCKNQGEVVSANSFDSLGLDSKTFEKFFNRYNEVINSFNSVDFDDLILYPRNILENNADIAKSYQEKWSYFLLDEFQDTNSIQFNLISLLLNEDNNLFAVGDDDQSIYGWRGADISIILGYKKLFPKAKIIMLEQNYRSNQHILDLANSTIQNNTGRFPKKLWSSKQVVETTEIKECDEPNEEGMHIADHIRTHKDLLSSSYKDFSILYRTNFQSRAIEEALRLRNIPYHVSGGYKFYDRKEIKDMIAYLRFLANQADERSLIRILNFPKRNITDNAIKKLSSYSLLSGKKIWEIILELEASPVNFSPAAFSGFLEFRDFINKLLPEVHNQSVGYLSKKVHDMIPWEKEYLHQNLEEKKIQNKLLNLRELLNQIYFFEDADNNIPGLKQDQERSIFSLIQYFALLSNEEQDPDDKDKVQLMTIHQSKGLEFKFVYLAGLADGFLPHTKSLVEQSFTDHDDAKNPIEEERRLFYVAITRAKDKVYMSYPAKKRNGKDLVPCSPSMFLSELPPDKVKHINTEEDDNTEANIENMFESLAAL
jgi:DNA helicase II / ATP-dependent DNA helicase PcrA